MRIATYNLWNSPATWPARLPAIREELTRIDADLVALQEVPARVAPDDPRDTAAYLAAHTPYSHHLFRAYPDDPDEGLAFLSRVPLTDIECGWDANTPTPIPCALRVHARVGDIDLAITNLHLDWQSAATREAEIVAITEWSDARTTPDRHNLLCGDFNARPESSIHTFLMGQQTLLGRETRPWHDLAASHAARLGPAPAPPTLDFATNPCWSQSPTLEIPARFDWLLLQDRYPHPTLRLHHAALFGVKPTPNTGIVPSDHYGVLADLT